MNDQPVMLTIPRLNICQILMRFPFSSPFKILFGTFLQNFWLIFYQSVWKQKSKIALQIGTLSACLFSLTLFLSLSLLTAITCDPTLLFHDCNYMSTISIWSPIVAIGVLLATFSASLNNIIGGSRVLEAVAKDVLFGPFLTYINKVSM